MASMELSSMLVQITPITPTYRPLTADKYEVCMQHGSLFWRAGEGIAEVAKAVRVERRGRDVYIMGAANVGKSAFVRCATTLQLWCTFHITARSKGWKMLMALLQSANCLIAKVNKRDHDRLLKGIT